MQAFSFIIYRDKVFCETRFESEQYGICKRYLDGYPYDYPLDANLVIDAKLSEFAAKQSHCFAKGECNQVNRTPLLKRFARCSATEPNGLDRSGPTNL
jgi:hypothetical protein